MLILIGAVPERLVHGDQSGPLLPSSLAPPGPTVSFSTATLIQGTAEGTAVSMLMEGEQEEAIRSIEDDFVVLLQYFSRGIRIL